MKELTVEYLEQLGACEEGIRAFERQKLRDTKLVLEAMTEADKWDWFCWLVVRLMTKEQKVQWAIFCAEQVLPIFEKRYLEDNRPRLAIEAARNWLKEPTSKNATYATYAAYAAAYAAYAAAYAAYAAAYADAYAAYAAAYAAYAAAYADKNMRIICANEAIRILFEMDGRR